MADEGEIARPTYEYIKIADDVAGKIQRGELTIGARLPNVNEMAGEYGVAVMTIRRAIRELRERGLVETLRSKGSFVSPKDQWGKPSSG